MSIKALIRPSDFSSAYLPVEYKMTSSFSGISGGVSFIAVSPLGDDFTRIVVDTRRSRRDIKVGGKIVLTGSALRLYEGEFNVVDSVGAGIVDIDAPFVGIDYGGTFNYQRLEPLIVCDLYMDGNFILRKTRYPNINDHFIFDFSKEIQINLGNNMKPVPLGDGTPVINSEAYSSIYIKYADSEAVMVDGIATPTLTLDQGQSPPDLFNDVANSRTVINAVVPYLEWEKGSVKNAISNSDTDLDSFKIESGSTNRFLTNSPKTITIGRTDSYQLSAIINYDAAISYQREVVEYDNSGGIVATNRDVFAPGVNSVWNLPCGGRDITINSSTVRYTVSISDGNDSNTVISELMTFKIDDKCHRTNTRFVWLNPRGGYDAFTFVSPRKLNSSISKKMYSPTRSFPVVIGNREEAITDVNAKDSISTSTNKVTKQYAEWLQELMESPQVFIELEAGNVLHDKRIPVTLINKTRAVSNSYDSLFNVSIRYRFGFNKIGLRAY